MPHMIEVAKSGRAGCRTCKKPIAKGELRFGEETINSFSGDGDTTFRWHHMKCAATKLASELKGALADFTGDVPDRAELETLMATAESSKPPPYPHADKAPSNRAKCLGCGDTIAKDTIRVAIEREIERGMMTTKGAGYLHPKCAAAYVETQGSSHDELTEALAKNTRALDDAEKAQLFAQV
jgi:hypothetical protein